MLLMTLKQFAVADRALPAPARSSGDDVERAGQGLAVRDPLFPLLPPALDFAP